MIFSFCYSYPQCLKLLLKYGGVDLQFNPSNGFDAVTMADYYRKDEIILPIKNALQISQEGIVPINFAVYDDNSVQQD